MDPVMSATDGVTVNHVCFAPGARTYWHYHENGQLLKVVTVSGLICAWSDQPQALEVDDVVWTSPGERHWHGGRQTQACRTWRSLSAVDCSAELSSVDSTCAVAIAAPSITDSRGAMACTAEVPVSYSDNAGHNSRQVTCRIGTTST